MTLPLSTGLIGAAVVFLDAAALLDPFDAGALEARSRRRSRRRCRCRRRRCHRPAGSARLAPSDSTISRSGTRRSGAASGCEWILREPTQRAGGDLRRDEIGGGDGLFIESLPSAKSSHEDSGHLRDPDCCSRLGRKKFLSLRRHDPDQVQRVAADAASQLPCGSTPRNSANVGRWRGVSTRVTGAQRYAQRGLVRPVRLCAAMRGGRLARPIRRLLVDQRRDAAHRDAAVDLARPVVGTLRYCSP